MSGFEPFNVIKRGLKVLRKEFSAEKNEKTPSTTEYTQTRIYHENNDSKVTTRPEVHSEIASVSKKPIFKQKNKGELASTSARPIPAALLVLYLDEKQNYLAAAQVLHGYRGQEIDLKLKRFSDYYISQIEGYTSTFIHKYGVIKIHYHRHQAAVVWLLAKDIDQQTMLAKPEFVRGKLHAPYSLVAPSFANYRLLQARGPVTGHFLERQQFVTYLYRQKLWEKVDEELRLLKTTDFIKCVSEPHGRTLKMTLAKNTFWQIFKTVTTTDNQIWYCLGGNTWVKADENIKVVDKNKYLTQMAQTNNVPESYAVSLKASATIDFIPGKKVNLYDLPCGKKTAQLMDGQNVKLSAQKNINGMQWYQVANVGWLLAEYLKF
ncbi:MucBP domain-containing protein [Ligilactobacillus acidipiscis]|uniref:MucBP domain-containing protein n=1 Tax=Ligilactobacillus acidipiscis TaxID=89059 RepID=UPI0023F91EC4|nr:MucBP domain-containing protein [Ligilactobacillus acidipiscis]WEV56185.1 MucBP domain-containing protein [Ligilactobacillus acidipiscis]